MTVKAGDSFSAEIEMADTFLKRLNGLMFKKTLDKGTGIILCPCNSVHTCFMNFTIDVIYLDKDYVIVGKETMKPWRAGRFFKGVKAIMELNEGEANDLEIGQKLLFADGH